jgi:hypothetical protein
MMLNLLPLHLAVPSLTGFSSYLKLTKGLALQYHIVEDARLFNKRFFLHTARTDQLGHFRD